MSKQGTRRRYQSRDVNTPRRRFLGGAATTLAAASAASFPLILVPGKARAKEQVVIATWGGTFQEAQTEAFFKPFTKETGIEVITTGAPDIAKIQAQVMTGNVDVDVVELSSGYVAPGEKHGLWEPVNTSIVDRTGLIPEAMRAHEVGYISYSGGIAWNKERNGVAGKHPTTWPEFWDVQKFPGRRGLRTRISDTLELALMGDGVAPKDVYPCDVERAFKALQRLKPAISNFIEETPKTITLLQRNECDFTHSFNGRVYAAQKESIPVDFSFRQNLVSIEWAAVVRKSRNREAAFKLINSFLDPKRLAVFTDMIAYPSTKPEALKLVSPAVRPWLPDLQAPDTLITSVDWWADKFDELTKRYKEWQFT